LQTPALDILFQYIDPATPSVPEGKADLQMEWRSSIVAGILVVGIGIGVARLISRRHKKA
jgi:hypothetical protein